MDRGVRWATVHGVAESDTTEQQIHTTGKKNHNRKWVEGNFVTPTLRKLSIYSLVQSNI